jgi:hypothetical protein
MTMAPIPFTSPRPWRWIASDLLEALRLAQTEIHNPGAARRAGKDIDAIVSAAINSAENDSPTKTEDQSRCK